jgi:hypothetical protein
VYEQCVRAISCIFVDALVAEDEYDVSGLGLDVDPNEPIFDLNTLER